MSESVIALVDEGPAGRIPVLDVGRWLSGAPGALEELAPVVARTCEDTGFLVVTNHGVPQWLIDECFAASASFFALPHEQKLALRVGELNIGYMPPGGQTIRTSRVADVRKPNLNETFYVTEERAPDHPDVLARAPFVGLNRWPPSLPAFRGAAVAYYDAMRRLSERMLPVFVAAMGMPPHALDGDFREATCTLRLLRYPPQPEGLADQFGFAPHIDTGMLTFLAQSALPGLEVRTRDGLWLRPPAIPGTFVVNTGEMLGRYSNDRFAPTPHRVVHQGTEPRYAIPFFYGPDNDAMIRVVPSCIGPDRPAKYEPLRYLDHRLKLNRTNFAHRQQQQAD
jgi:isopenicillin N synthase-like dioxygenase